MRKDRSHQRILDWRMNGGTMATSHPKAIPLNPTRQALIPVVLSAGEMSPPETILPVATIRADALVGGILESLEGTVDRVGDIQVVATLIRRVQVRRAQVLRALILQLTLQTRRQPWWPD